jgi:hypothetical protein
MRNNTNEVTAMSKLHPAIRTLIAMLMFQVLSAAHADSSMPTVRPDLLPKGGIESQRPLPGIAPQAIKPAGCADPSVVELRPGWPRRNADGTYTFHLLAITKNVGSAEFESLRRQTLITLREGPRVLRSEVWSSARADTVVLAPGQGFSTVYVVERWNPSSEFLADFTGEISYDPDIRIDNNRKNDDCVMTNNKRTLSVAELRRLLSTVR